MRSKRWSLAQLFLVLTLISVLILHFGPLISNYFRPSPSWIKNWYNEIGTLVDEIDPHATYAGMGGSSWQEGIANITTSSLTFRSTSVEIPAIVERLRDTLKELLASEGWTEIASDGSKELLASEGWTEIASDGSLDGDCQIMARKGSKRCLISIYAFVSLNELNGQKANGIRTVLLSW